MAVTRLLCDCFPLSGKGVVCNLSWWTGAAGWWTPGGRSDRMSRTLLTAPRGQIRASGLD